jgi:hypothetical protein
VLLLYLEAAFGFVFGARFLSSLGLLILAAYVAGGYGIANGKKWGYGLAVGSVAFRLALYLADGLGDALRDPISLMLTIALAALLLHPESRNYQRIWFS